jgi:hypothetical protein
MPYPVMSPLDFNCNGDESNIYYCKGFSSCKLYDDHTLHREDAPNKQFDTVLCYNSFTTEPDPFDPSQKVFVCRGPTVMATNLSS